jgi:hypothetical protein
MMADNSFAEADMREVSGLKFMAGREGKQELAEGATCRLLCHTFANGWLTRLGAEVRASGCVDVGRKQQCSRC